MGEGIDTSDIYELKKENEKLKNQLDIMNTKGFDLIQMQMQKFFEDKGSFGGGGNNDQMERLINDNQDLKKMFAEMASRGGPGTGGQTLISDHNSTHPAWNNDYMKPYANVENDGSVQRGVSRKF
jgi:hypothetical protein